MTWLICFNALFEGARSLPKSSKGTMANYARAAVGSVVGLRH